MYEVLHSNKDIRPQTVCVDFTQPATQTGVTDYVTIRLLYVNLTCKKVF